MANGFHPFSVLFRKAQLSFPLYTETTPLQAEGLLSSVATGCLCNVHGTSITGQGAHWKSMWAISPNLV